MAKTKKGEGSLSKTWAEHFVYIKENEAAIGNAFGYNFGSIDYSEVMSKCKLNSTMLVHAFTKPKSTESVSGFYSELWSANSADSRFAYARYAEQIYTLFQISSYKEHRKRIANALLSDDGRFEKILNTQSSQWSKEDTQYVLAAIELDPKMAESCSEILQVPTMYATKRYCKELHLLASGTVDVPTVELYDLLNQWQTTNNVAAKSFCNAFTDWLSLESKEGEGGGDGGGGVHLKIKTTKERDESSMRIDPKPYSESPVNFEHCNDKFEASFPDTWGVFKEKYIKHDKASQSVLINVERLELLSEDEKMILTKLSLFLGEPNRIRIDGFKNPRGAATKLMQTLVPLAPSMPSSTRALMNYSNPLTSGLRSVVSDPRGKRGRSEKISKLSTAGEFVVIGISFGGAAYGGATTIKLLITSGSSGGATLILTTIGTTAALTLGLWRLFKAIKKVRAKSSFRGELKILRSQNKDIDLPNKTMPISSISSSVNSPESSSTPNVSRAHSPQPSPNHSSHTEALALKKQKGERLVKGG